MALVNATTTERLLRLVEAGKLDIDRLVTHSQSSKVSLVLYTDKMRMLIGLISCRLSFP